MKFFAGLVISAGLVSANLARDAPGAAPGGANLQAGPPPPPGGNENNGLFGSNDGLDSLDGLDELDGLDGLDSIDSEDGLGGLDSLEELDLGGGLGGSLDLSELDPELESSGLDLSGLQNSEIGGVNLGSVDLNNNDEMIAAILELLNGLCLGNVFSQSSLGGMQSNQLQDLLLEIAEVWELLELGFTNIGNVQNMFLSSVQQGGSSELNAGILKRAVEAQKKTLKRMTLRRGNVKRQFQCAQQVLVSNGTTTTIQVPESTGSGSLSIATDLSSTATEAAVSVATTAAAAAATETAAAASSAEDTATATAAAADSAASGEPLSDFTR